MARVIVDVSALSKSWFSKALDEMIKSGKVTFPYSNIEKFESEHEKQTKVKTLFKLLGDMGLREDCDNLQVQKHSDFLASQPEWQKEKDCDDPHIFGLVYTKPTRFVMSGDEDIANCRNCMRKCVKRRYCSFIVVVSEATYLSHRHKILS